MKNEINIARKLLSSTKIYAIFLKNKCFEILSFNKLKNQKSSDQLKNQKKYFFPKFIKNILKIDFNRLRLVKIRSGKKFKKGGTPERTPKRKQSFKYKIF